MHDRARVPGSRRTRIPLRSLRALREPQFDRDEFSDDFEFVGFAGEISSEPAWRTVRMVTSK